MAESSPNCELCHAKASLYCHSDSAFLCFSCDSLVHSANFLFARHLRSSICPTCRHPDGNRFSGAVTPPTVTIACRNCDLHSLSSPSSSSSSSSCVSSTGGEVHAPAIKRREKVKEVVVAAVDRKVEAVLVNWCLRFEMEDVYVRRVLNSATELYGCCFGEMTIVPFRVLLAASFWVAVRLCCGGSAREDLRKVERISGVPAKLIVTTESGLARVFKRRQSREEHAEGWAEC